jgi:cytochrome c
MLTIVWMKYHQVKRYGSTVLWPNRLEIEPLATKVSEFVAVAALLLMIGINPALAQDAANGENVFKKCRTCHQVGDAAKTSVGPVLNGIVGRMAGSMEGYSYSPANKEAGSKGLVWSEENLFKYLENPVAFMPKTKMVFPGLKDEQDRKDVIAYLKKYAK